MKKKKEKKFTCIINIEKLIVLTKALNLSIMWREGLIGNERLT